MIRYIPHVNYIRWTQKSFEGKQVCWALYGWLDSIIGIFEIGLSNHGKIGTGTPRSYVHSNKKYVKSMKSFEN